MSSGDSKATPSAVGLGIGSPTVALAQRFLSPRNLPQEQILRSILDPGNEGRGRGGTAMDPPGRGKRTE